MKVFQLIHKYETYISSFEKRYNVESLNFKEHLNKLIEDRFYGCHILKPCLNMDKDAFYTIWNYEKLQLKWAQENGINGTDLKSILFAQIEHFKPDVLYNMSPIFFNKIELEKNISKDIIKVAWYASPEKNNIEFGAYKTRLTNYPNDVINTQEKQLFRSDLFYPSYDNIFDNYKCTYENKTTNILFYGQYLKQYFDSRNEFVDKLLQYKRDKDNKICIHLQYEKSSVVKNEFIEKVINKFRFNFNLPILNNTFPNKLVLQYSNPPLYGLELYNALANSKMVFNFPVDFTGEFNVNMRNYETLSAGCHLITKRGIYPPGFEENKHYSAFDNFDDFIKIFEYFKKHPEESIEIAVNGNKMIKELYSKENQWDNFKKIVANFS